MWRHVRKGSLEVALVLRAGVLGFEQQRQFGSEVRDAVWGVADDLAVREADRLVAPADPGVAVVWFPEDVEQVLAGGRIAKPGLVCVGQLVWGGVLPDPPFADRVKGERPAAVADLGEPRRRDGDLDVPVLPGLLPAEQIQSPSPDHTPGCGDPAQAASNFIRRPGIRPAGTECLDVGDRQFVTVLREPSAHPPN